MAPLVSPFVLFLLAMLSIPGSSPESRIDVIDSGGTVSVMHVRRTEGGFEVTASRNGASVPVMMARPVEGKDLVYVMRDLESGTEETVDLPVLAKGFDQAAWHSGRDLTIEGPESSTFRLVHSGTVTYVTATVASMVLVVHP